MVTAQLTLYLLLSARQNWPVSKNQRICPLAAVDGSIYVVTIELFPSVYWIASEKVDEFLDVVK